jgi:hypothetical protein
VVTSQRGRFFNPLTESMPRLAHIRKEALLESIARPLFYRDKFSRGETASIASLPGKSGS